jgi:transcriptional regulator with XRE-family HTH domain
MGINLMADLGFDENAEDVKRARSAARMYAGVIDTLVRYRKKLGLTQKKVAKRMGTTQSAVSEFESVNADARFSTLIRYAQAIDCNVEIQLEPKSAVWVQVKMVDSTNVIPFEASRYQHIPERIEALADSVMRRELALAK